MTKNKIKVCYVLSYKAPDYVRTRVLLEALRKLSEVELYTAINSSKSTLHYLQTLWRLVIVRLTKHPDVYILGFRGQEIYWPVRWLTYPKPLIIDEFINMHDWLVAENKKLKEGSLLTKIAHSYVRSVLKSSRAILTDTNLNAQSSSQTYGIPIGKYQPIYVGADETVFYPRQAKQNKNLEVFFYGNMAPLHGIKHVLEAANELKHKAVHFTIIGGKGKPDTINSIKNFIKIHHLKNVTYQDWADFNSLPEIISDCDLFLGGPFGNTSQAKRVITGKTFQSLAVGTATVIGKIDEDVGFVDKANCLLVEQGSSQAITEALIWASSNRSRLNGIGEAGYRLYQQSFSIKRVADKLKTTLESI